MNYTAKTRRAIKTYGFRACVEAHRLNVSGEGAATIAQQYPLNLKTTRQADAAINAGREIIELRALPVQYFTEEGGWQETKLDGLTVYDAVEACAVRLVSVAQAKADAVIKHLNSIQTCKVHAFRFDGLCC